MQLAQEMHLTQSEDTGNIVLDKDKCNGCGWCIEACDYGAIMLHPETKVVYVCDLCKDKAMDHNALNGAQKKLLTVVTSDVLAQKARISAIKKLFQEPKEPSKKRQFFTQFLIFNISSLAEIRSFAKPINNNKQP